MAATAQTVSLSDSDWEHRTADLEEVSLHYVAAGPEDGDLAVLLHGFPDFWYSWRHQIPALAEAGYRVVAPDMRGYNRSDRPEGVDAYDLDRLVADVAGLVDHCGRESARVVGHDWGGLVAWQVAIDRPSLVDRLAILNAPHPSAYEEMLRNSLAQIARSWYAFYFQIPRLPEWALGRDDFAALESTYREMSASDDAFTDLEVRQYKRVFDREGALTAAINYYRALFRRNAKLTLFRGGVGDLPVHPPTLVLWGERDRALDPRLTRGLDRWVADVRVRRFPGADHWVHRDEPERVNEALTEFL